MSDGRVPESVIETKAKKFARANGWRFIRKVRWIGRRSAPDRLFVKKGRHVWVEFKRPGVKRPRPGQGREIARMRKAGMEVYVIDNLDDAYALFG